MSRLTVRENDDSPRKYAISTTTCSILFHLLPFQPVLIRQLPTGRVNIFSPATTHSAYNSFRVEQCAEGMKARLCGFLKFFTAYRIVLYDVHLGFYLHCECGQFPGVF